MSPTLIDGRLPAWVVMLDVMFNRTALIVFALGASAACSRPPPPSSSESSALAPPQTMELEALAGNAANESRDPMQGDVTNTSIPSGVYKMSHTIGFAGEGPVQVEDQLVVKYRSPSEIEFDILSYGNNGHQCDHSWVATVANAATYSTRVGRCELRVSGIGNRLSLEVMGGQEPHRCQPEGVCGMLGHFNSGEFVRVEASQDTVAAP